MGGTREMSIIIRLVPRSFPASLNASLRVPAISPSHHAMMGPFTETVISGRHSIFRIDTHLSDGGQHGDMPASSTVLMMYQATTSVHGIHLWSSRSMIHGLISHTVAVAWEVSTRGP